MGLSSPKRLVFRWARGATGNKGAECLTGGTEFFCQWMLEVPGSSKNRRVVPLSVAPFMEGADSDMVAPTDRTESTVHYWQGLHDDLPEAERQTPYRFAFPVRLPDGRYLKLPIRQRQLQPDRAVASFIANHASFTVLDALAGHMADQVRHASVDIVVGLPTLGLALAPPLARALGQDRFVPFGTSRKYWYEETLSEEATSITTTAVRRLYLDPNLLPLLDGRRVLLVDDTISSGTTASAALRLLRKAGADVVGLAFAMSQGMRWRALFEEQWPEWLDKISFVFQTPHLEWLQEADGWTPVRTP